VRFLWGAGRENGGKSTFFGQGRTKNTCRRRAPKKPIVNHPIIFFNREDVWKFQQATKKFAVVEKKAGHFALIKAFSRLDEARTFVKGTRLIVWYVPVH